MPSECGSARDCRGAEDCASFEKNAVTSDLEGQSYMMAASKSKSKKLVVVAFCRIAMMETHQAAPMLNCFKTRDMLDMLTASLRSRHTQSHNSLNVARAFSFPNRRVHRRRHSRVVLISARVWPVQKRFSLPNCGYGYRMLCPPAVATSIARLACIWPRTSRKSTG